MIYTPFLLLVTPLVSAGLMRASNNLLTLDTSVDVSNILACQGMEVKNCVAATVNWEALKNPEQDSIILPTGDELFKKSTLQTYGKKNIGVIGEISESFEYKNNAGAEAVLTFKANSLYGNVELEDGRDYIMEKYNDKLILWKEIDQSVFEDDHDESSGEPMETRSVGLPHMNMDELLAMGLDDRKTVKEYSVTVYYTRGFKDSTADIASFIDSAIALTNLGYINSNVPLRVKKHCIVESDISDNMTHSKTLKEFASLHNYDNNKIRRSADTAILLVNKFRYNKKCGVAKGINEIFSGNTIGVVVKHCALARHTFGHEIGHLFGLHHNRRAYPTNHNASPFYSYGYIIKRGKYRSIMAVSRKGKRRERRVNHYSSPDISYDGWRTGAVYNDNARVLTDNRFAAAAIGDESMICPEEPTRSPFVDKWSIDDCIDKYDNCNDLAALGLCRYLVGKCGKTCIDYC